MSNRRKTVRELAVVALLLMVIVILSAAPILAQSGLSRQRLEWAIAKRLLVSGISTFQGAATFDSSATIAGATTVDDVTIGGNIASRALYTRLQDVKDDASNNVLAATAVATTTTSITSTSLTQPDYPRNIRITLTSAAQRAAGNITVSGTDAQGNSTSETLAMTAITATEALTGSVPWAVVDTIALPTQTGSITVTIGLGEKFGLPLIPQASADVFFFTKANAYTSSYTVNTTYGTVLPTADVAANDDYTIGVKQ